MNSFIIESIINNKLILAYQGINQIDKNELVDLKNEVCKEENKILKRRCLVQLLKQNAEKDENLMLFVSLNKEREYLNNLNNYYRGDDYYEKQKDIFNQSQMLKEQNEDIYSKYNKYNEVITYDRKLVRIINRFKKIKPAIESRIDVIDLTNKNRKN